MSKERKFIAVKFARLSDADETNIRGFITRELTQKNLTVDEPTTLDKKKREVFRVRFRNAKVKVVTEATQKVPQLELEVLLEDLSVGGCCISIPADQSVAKGGTIYLTLHFCQPPISVRGEILGLRRD